MAILSANYEKLEFEYDETVHSGEGRLDEDSKLPKDWVFSGFPFRNFADKSILPEGNEVKGKWKRANSRVGVVVHFL